MKQVEPAQQFWTSNKGLSAAIGVLVPLIYAYGPRTLFLITNMAGFKAAKSGSVKELRLLKAATERIIGPLAALLKWN
jgi:hypothetical protein